MQKGKLRTEQEESACRACPPPPQRCPRLSAAFSISPEKGVRDLTVSVAGALVHMSLPVAGLELVASRVSLDVPLCMLGKDFRVAGRDPRRLYRARDWGSIRGGRESCQDHAFSGRRASPPSLAEGLEANGGQDTAGAQKRK